MKSCIFLVLLLTCNHLWAQSTLDSAAPQTFGPGIPLPKNSDQFSIKPDPLFQGANTFAAKIAPLAEELVGLLWLISFLYLAGSWQNNGSFQPLIESLIRLALTFVVLSAINTTLIPAFNQTLENLKNLVPPSSSIGAIISGSLLGTAGAIGLSALLSGGLSLVATVVGIVAFILILILTSLIQLVGKTFCIAIAPLACACLAFKSTSGIFSGWLKSFLIFNLTPLVWRICLSISESLIGSANGFQGFAVALFVMGAQSVFFSGGPALTAWFINKAGSHHTGMAIGSPVERIASMAQNFISTRRGSGGGGNGLPAPGHAAITEFVKTDSGTAKVIYQQGLGRAENGGALSQIFGGNAPPAMSQAARQSIFASMGVQPRNKI